MNPTALHTPEPWKTDQRAKFAIYAGPAGHGKGICAMKNTHEAKEALANVRRIIACVNACAGIPTNALEERVIRDLIGALRWLLDDLSDAEEDRNPQTGEVYDSVAHANDVLRRATFPDLPQAA